MRPTYQKPSQTLSRRKLLRGSILAGAALAVSPRALFLAETISPEPQIEEPFKHGRKIGDVSFTEEVPVPMGQAFGAELDRRLYTDLSLITPENISTPADSFYIRTGASHLLPGANLSSIKVRGLVDQPFELAIGDLVQLAVPQGRHLMECAGNARAVHFGMMSVADWAGVPVSEIIRKAKIRDKAGRVLIAGFDTYANPSSTSMPGASWVFTLDQLESARAFLATEMDGQQLTADHGAPVRLVVPGWYGCACIKWVNEITLVDDDVPVTSQMQEYASRTLQNGVPRLARDYQPATIDPAAMPIRIEKWVVNGATRYRVVGILWGGTQPVKTLEIRFNPEEEYKPVDHLDPGSNDPWRIWTHSGMPQRPGTYMIRLRVKEPRVTTRRLDQGYYLRTVEITET